MSTHVSTCIVCERPTSCCSDAFVLGVGDGGCYQKGLKMDFCSGACFLELRRRMEERLADVKERFPDVLNPAPPRPTVIPPDDACWGTYYACDAIAYEDDGVVILRQKRVYGDELDSLIIWLTAFRDDARR